jgi:hypothetical protein
MTHRFFSRALPIAGILLCLSQVHCLLVPKDTETGARVGNLTPSVRITAGAASPDPAGVDYKVQFQWSGADEDGVVSLYRWAVDDTVSESAWHDTTGFSATFRFFATTSRPNQPTNLSDWHTFYIRAIDNEFSISPAERRYFNATTIAPTSRVSEPSPRILQTQNKFQRTFNVRWDGEDLDSSRPDRKPVAYEYKLVYVDDYTPDSTVVRHLLTYDNILLSTLRVGDKTRWIRVPEEQRTAELRDLLPTGGDIHSYAFCVRAVDEAGAIEPVLIRNRNFFCFTVTTALSAPYVTVTEETLGSHIFPSQGDTWDNVTVFVGRPYRFRWTGNASYYGSSVGNVNYGLDIPDPEDETRQDTRGIGGWIGWGAWPGNQEPFIFSRDQAGSYHYLYIYMRDVSNTLQSTRRCLVRMHVVDFSFSRFALVVDDAALSDVTVTDTMHDQFINSTLLRKLTDYGAVDSWAVYGENDASSLARKLPDEMLVQYQNIIWNLSYGSKPNSGINLTEIVGNRGLSSFLAAGGRLFIAGGPVLGAMRLHNNFYPRTPPPPTGGTDTDRTDREELWYHFLYMRNTVYSYSASNSTCNVETGGLVSVLSRNPNYPDLYLDTRKWNPETILSTGKLKGGIAEFEGFKLAAQNDTRIAMEGLDSLYTARTFNRSRSPQCANIRGSADNSICGWRYESTRADTLANRQHGRVIVFDFQPYYFQPGRITDAGTAAVNWLVTGRDR